jgi:hypothetical protein
MRIFNELYSGTSGFAGANVPGTLSTLSVSFQEVTERNP